MPVASSSYGKTPAGEEVTLYTLSNGTTTAKVITFGGNVINLQTPDRKGEVTDITLGYDSLDMWMDNPTFFGCLVGRVGNRVAQGKFTVDGKEYQLAQNNDENHLHGGPTGFHKRNWTGSVAGEVVTLVYVSADMEEGYPGELTATVTYEVTPANELIITYKATTTKTTIVNLTNHSYFNLAGAGSGSTILNHEFESPCRAYVPVDDGCIPTGDVASVEGTPFDFRTKTAIGARNDSFANGYDHNLCVNRVGKSDTDLALVGTMTEPVSGRTLTVTTTEPGCQLYCAGFLDGSNVGREGKGYPRYGGFCLETQHYPDAVNQPNFKTYVLTPSETYSSKTVFAFGVSA